MGIQDKKTNQPLVTISSYSNLMKYIHGVSEIHFINSICTAEKYSMEEEEEEENIMTEI